MPTDSIKTVLVVDDEQPVRELTARVLSGAGYRVITARDGFHALRLLGQVVEEIDLILTDIRMAGDERDPAGGARARAVSAAADVHVGICV